MFGSPVAEKDRLAPGAEHEFLFLLDQFVDVEVGIWPHPDINRYDSRSVGKMDGRQVDYPFPNDLGVPSNHEIVFTPNYRKRLVDWTNVSTELGASIERLGAPKDGNPAVTTGLEVASAMIAALGTGIAALGPAGALPAGLVMGIGALLVIILGGPQSSGPRPLTAKQFSEIVAQEVRRELDKHAAQKAAHLFVLATEKLADYRSRAGGKLVDSAGQFNGNDLSSNERVEFELFVSSALSGATSDTLEFHVFEICNEPDRAKWIVPEYFAGVGTYLTLAMVDVLRRSEVPGSPPKIEVSDYDADSFRDKVATQIQGLKNALAAFEAMVTEKVVDLGLQDSIREEEARRLIRTSILGVPDLKCVDEGIVDLENLVKTLDKYPGGKGLSI